MKILENASANDLETNTRENLNKLVRKCKACHLTERRTHRLLFSIKDDITGEFNHRIEIDIMTLPHGHVLHVVYSGTPFQIGRFVRNMTADNGVPRAQRALS